MITQSRRKRLFHEKKTELNIINNPLAALESQISVSPPEPKAHLKNERFHDNAKGATRYVFSPPKAYLVNLEESLRLKRDFTIREGKDYHEHADNLRLSHEFERRILMKTKFEPSNCLARQVNAYSVKSYTGSSLPLDEVKYFVQSKVEDCLRILAEKSAFKGNLKMEISDNERFSNEFGFELAKRLGLKYDKASMVMENLYKEFYSFFCIARERSWGNIKVESKKVVLQIEKEKALIQLLL